VLGFIETYFGKFVSDKPDSGEIGFMWPSANGIGSIWPSANCIGSRGPSSCEVDPMGKYSDLRGSIKPVFAEKPDKISVLAASESIAS
jgi:hypothetical protein